MHKLIDEKFDDVIFIGILTELDFCDIVMATELMIGSGEYSVTSALI